ncbi:hypothetical protein DRE_06429 [Drechslerella stenobrocha 248]|uniref:Histone acetyltransferase n=1 Tax=Drechslerella stenobrocha 248 TaxID=1043628 RepID=W7HLB6_9PEZI|nr:hypothetical protein DRE_06429 [Drechslerella stenobrocha 248]
MAATTDRSNRKKRKRDTDDEGDDSETPSTPLPRAATAASVSSDGTSASESESGSDSGSGSDSESGSGSESGSESGSDNGSVSGDSNSLASGSTEYSGSNSSSSDDDSGGSDAEPDAREVWDDPSDNDDVVKTSPSTCIFCGGEDDEDPSGTFEELLECKICGNTAHRQCARNHNGSSRLPPGNEGVSNWRCSTCTALSLDQDIPEETGEIPAPRLKLRLKNTSETTQGRQVTTPSHHDADSSVRRLRARPSDEFQTPQEARPQRQIRRTNYLQLHNTPGIDGHAEPEGEASATPIRISSRQRKTRFPEGNSMGASVQKLNQRLILRLKFKPEKLAYAIATSPSILSQYPKRGGRGTQTQPWMTPGHANPFQPPPQVQYSHYTIAHYESVMDDQNARPYGGILNETEADTSKTIPVSVDKIKFDKARQEADEEKAQREAMLAAAIPTSKSSKRHDQSLRASSHASMIKCVHFGNYQIDTWYAAPYPEEYSRNRNLYLCEFCLKYMNSEFVQWRHRLKCPHKNPPGDEIYREGTISIFEVDGRKQPAYCQNLCLLAKLFLGSKTLYYDVDQFLFYVMAEYNETGCHFVGYFSKEKRSTSSNNVSCILTLPIHQRKGYGHLLIDFSYLLTRTEGRLGSPEKPLSDLGLVSYRNYWKLTLCYLLRDIHGGTSVTAMCDETGMTPDDVISALENLHALIRDPITKTYAFRIDREMMQSIIDKWESKGYVKLNPRALVWVPFVMGRQSLLQNAPPTIAPREDEPILEEGVLVDQTVVSTPAAEGANTPKDSVMSHEETASIGRNGDPMDVDFNGIHASEDFTEHEEHSPPSTKLTPPEDPPSATKRNNTSFIRLGDDPFRRASSTPAKELPTRVAVDPNYIPPTRFQLVSSTGSSNIKKPKFTRSPSSASSSASKTTQQQQQQQQQRVVSAPPSASRTPNVAESKAHRKVLPPQPTPQQQIRKARSSLFEEAREPHSMTIIRQSSRKSTRVSLAPRGHVPSPAPSTGGQITVITNGGSGDYESTDQMNDSDGSLAATKSVKSSKSDFPGTKL